MPPQTMLDKIWEAHDVGDGLLYIDLHLVHEVTSPQAFEGLRLAARSVRRPDRTLATVDHNVPTDRRRVAAHRRPTSRVQVRDAGAQLRGVRRPALLDWAADRQGIVHVIGPELGLTQPGMTIVCGDSHTSTHGAFGALAFGIGTSEVEHVLATQCLLQSKPQTLLVRFDGTPGFGRVGQGPVLATIGEIGVAGAVGYAVEYAGAAIAELSMEGRMTVCNMTIEAGAPRRHDRPRRDDVRLFRGPAVRPAGAAFERRAMLLAHAAAATPGARFDREVVIDAAASRLRSPGARTRAWSRRRGAVPVPAALESRPTATAAERALRLHGSRGGHPDPGDPRSTASSSAPAPTRGIGDLRAAAAVVKGRRVASHVNAMVVPGSEQVCAQAEAEGLDEVFREAGFDWRERRLFDVPRHEPGHPRAGRALRLDLEPQLRGPPGRAAAARTSCHPEMAAAAAIAGHFVDIRDWS